MRIYRTILRSYVSRWQFWVMLALWLCQVVGYAAGAWPARGHRGPWPMLLMGVGYSAIAVAAQVKEQFGAYRAALVPGFRVPHLAVGLFWLVVAMLPFPALTAVGGGSPLGVLGLALPMAGLAFAAGCRGGWRAALFGCSFIVVFVPGVATAATALVGGEYPWAAVALALIGLWLVVDCSHFLLTMDEETPGYDLQFRGNLRQLGGPQARRSMLTAFRRLDRQHSIWLRLVDAQLPQAMPYVGASHWQRLRHWRRAHANGWLTMVWPSIMWLFMLAIQYGLWRGRPEHAALMLHSTLWVVVMMPSLVGMNVWQLRGGTLPRELTYPVWRRDFIIEQGLAILLAHALAWVLLAGTMVATVACLPGQAPPWRDVLVTLSVSGPWQLVLFALLARLSTLSSAIPMIVGLVVGGMAGTALLFGCMHLDTAVPCAVVAGASTVLGLAGISLAYRHWLRVDLP